MAESSARASDSADPIKPLVIHFNGAFHSDYHLGAAARTQRRLADSRVKVVSIIPIDELDTIDVKAYRPRGDYLIFTLKPKRKI